MYGLEALTHAAMDGAAELFVEGRVAAGPHGGQLRKRDLRMPADECYEVDRRPKGEYEAMLSYRRDADGRFAQQMWQRLTCCTLKGRRLRVFYDQRGSLPLGERFDENLVRAIELSAVFVPIVSYDVLSHINANIERNTVDWLLLEWMHALHVARQPGSTLRIFPIIFGHKDVPGAAGARRMSVIG